MHAETYSCERITNKRRELPYGSTLNQHLHISWYCHSRCSKQFKVAQSRCRRNFTS